MESLGVYLSGVDSQMLKQVTQSGGTTLSAVCTNVSGTSGVVYMRVTLTLFTVRPGVTAPVH